MQPMSKWDLLKALQKLLQQVREEDLRHFEQPSHSLQASRYTKKKELKRIENLIAVILLRKFQKFC